MQLLVLLLVVVMVLSVLAAASLNTGTACAAVPAVVTAETAATMAAEQPCLMRGKRNDSGLGLYNAGGVGAPTVAAAGVAGVGGGGGAVGGCALPMVRWYRMTHIRLCIVQGIGDVRDGGSLPLRKRRRGRVCMVCCKDLFDWYTS